MNRHHPYGIGIALLQFPFDFHIVFGHPVDKPLQIGNMLLLKRQRQIHKLVQTVLRFRPQTGHKLLPSLKLAQNMGIKFKRTNFLRQIAQFLQKGINIGVFPIRRQPAPNRRSRIASVTQGKQIVVIKPEQRRLQNLGQRQIISGQQQKPPQRNQILYRNLLGKFDFINPGNRHAGILAGPHQFFDKAVAPLYQNHKIAIAQRPPLRCQTLTAFDHFADSLGNFASQTRTGRFGADSLHRRQPNIRILPFFRFGQRPKFNFSGIPDPERNMGNVLIFSGNAGLDRRLRKNGVDHVQNR